MCSNRWLDLKQLKGDIRAQGAVCVTVLFGDQPAEGHAVTSEAAPGSQLTRLATKQPGMLNTGGP